jgi:hypothetical protein
MEFQSGPDAQLKTEKIVALQEAPAESYVTLIIKVQPAFLHGH